MSRNHAVGLYRYKGSRAIVIMDTVAVRALPITTVACINSTAFSSVELLLAYSFARLYPYPLPAMT